MKPKETNFEPKTLGEHLRKRRLELGLSQKEAADQLGVNSWTILNWEKSHTEPPVRALPAIFRFLGYDPFPEPDNLSKRLLAKRREKGWSIKKAAMMVGVDPGTWKNWEGGKTILYRKHRARIAEILGLSLVALHDVMASRWNRLHEQLFRDSIRGSAS